MPRHEGHPGGAYTIPVVVKLNAEGLKALDQVRGKTPRGTYLRRLLRVDVRQFRDKLSVAPLDKLVEENGGPIGVDDY